MSNTLDATKKPGDVGASLPAEVKRLSHNTTKEEIVSMLEALLLKCNEDVVSLEPMYSKTGELVTIRVTFLGGSVRYASVFADSHMAICRDVLNQVFR